MLQYVTICYREPPGDYALSTYWIRQERHQDYSECWAQRSHRSQVTGHRVKVDWEIDILIVDITIAKLAVGGKVLHK